MAAHTVVGVDLSHLEAARRSVAREGITLRLNRARVALLLRAHSYIQRYPFRVGGVAVR